MLKHDSLGGSYPGLSVFTPCKLNRVLLKGKKPQFIIHVHYLEHLEKGAKRMYNWLIKVGWGKVQIGLIIFISIKCFFVQYYQIFRPLNEIKSAKRIYHFIRGLGIPKPN